MEDNIRAFTRFQESACAGACAASVPFVTIKI
jgi:hypothetical protein